MRYSALGPQSEMTFRQARTSIGSLWGLACVFAAILLGTWAGWGSLAGSDRPPGLLAAVVMAVAMLIAVAAVATRRIEGLSGKVGAQEQAHIATLDQVAQLELSNAVLQVVARSVDVPLAFQTLAQRIVRLVPCD